MKIGDFVEYKGHWWTITDRREDMLNNLAEYYIECEDMGKWVYEWEWSNTADVTTYTKQVKLHKDGYYHTVEAPEEKPWAPKKCCKNPNVREQTVLFEKFYVCKNCKKETDKNGFVK